MSDTHSHHDHSQVAAPKLSTAALLGIGAAAGLVPLNSTMIAVALPRITDDFDISTGTASILVTVYLVAMLVGQPLAGLHEHVQDFPGRALVRTKPAAQRHPVHQLEDDERPRPVAAARGTQGV